ncbi:TetR/AcrR family transcriptional regulator [Nocardia sp. CDC159]|uniref:TetR/AcrR family transcriptional regulator n=1 Tax=Nocardia pulmonis TaxID=2951408 RepID=A0A9X2E856_9NOCA|nr:MULTISPECIES: TetR/AcrR family transcriptional regulator [Nocardia]MCM6775371.1 TetR/AcrR family transcriptional regulator [Nocardia pulmonis]MCM6787895.1 TetR/AcrR family transcriptional regulator [Nocardia sp. CDC159]
MNAVKPRREMYAESTREALLQTGREMFLERGYPAVAAEDLVRAAGLSRGALYHHFGGKQGLFEAVFEEQEQRAVRRITAATADHDDPWQQFLAALDAALDICAERDYRELVFLQGPLALGWSRWRELDQRYFGGLLAARIRTLLASGLIQNHPAELLAAAVDGCITELCLRVAESEDIPAARRDAGRLLRALLTGLATTAPREHPSD